MPRVRLDLAYDGTAFNGWAKQPGQRTVQGTLEDALAMVFRAPVGLVVAGRTDAGVHATGQVAHLDVTDEQLAALDQRGRPVTQEALGRRLNGILGLKSDLVISRSSFAPEGFDARFSPLWRRYQYRIADAAAPRNPLTRLHTLWYPARLDEHAMNSAAHELLGLHDWAAYCRPRVGATTIRTLQAFEWDREPDGTLVARLQADAFCHSMVRALVGATVAVGQGALPQGRLADIRDAGERTNEFKVMPAHGLTLTEVGYPPDDELGVRAEQTRARRDTEPVE
jgi:tRNA pseudouridine38-40 synthase